MSGSPAPLFEPILSAEAAKRPNPAREAYDTIASALSVEIGKMRLVAAHTWDLAGAPNAGSAAAFVARPGMVLDPLVPALHIVGTNPAEVADRVLDVERV